MADEEKAVAVSEQTVAATEDKSAAVAQEAPAAVEKKSSPLQRVWAVIVVIFGIIGLVVCVGAVIGMLAIWSPLREGVSAVADVADNALTTVNNGLATVNDTLDQAQGTLNLLDQVAIRLGDRIEASSPVLTIISATIGAELFPKIDKASTVAADVSQAVVRFNTALVTINRLPSVEVPTLSEEIGKVSDLATQVKAAGQDLRAQVAEMKAGVAAGAVNLISKPITAVRNVVTRVQEPVTKYETATAEAKTKVQAAEARVLRIINVAIVLGIFLFIVLGAGQILLIRAGARLW